jgi:hypothetical protein
VVVYRDGRLVARSVGAVLKHVLEDALELDPPRPAAA